MAHRARFRKLITAEVRHLTTVDASSRAWQLPVGATLASGLPLLTGAYAGQMALGLAGSLGGLVFLYLPNAPMRHRMARIAACSIGLSASYALGLLCQFVPQLMVPVLMLIAMAATMITRHASLGPPGSLLFLMVAALAAFTPAQAAEIPLLVGAIALGSVLACLAAFIFSLSALRSRELDAMIRPPGPAFDYVVVDSVAIGAFVGMALALAQALELDKPYWVAISCLAVIQESSFRAVWNRQLQRIIGTVLGLGVAFALLQLPMNKWSISVAIMALTLVIEFAVVRHYGLAAMFITPLAILFAEAPTLGHAPVLPLIEARFYDTLLGCIAGLAGGACLHAPEFRRVLGKMIRAVLSARRTARPGRRR